MRIFPNPVSNALNIEFVALRRVDARLQLLNAGGQLLSQQSIVTVPGENSIQLDLKELPAGLYYVSVTALENSLRYKIVVQ
ncbi:MAG: T9SS type A sorting domain-containing protein [Bacteroidota bacterium]|nr:T9SS type A sorting domain-containing protein [Bacteroidota bacterium]